MGVVLGLIVARGGSKGIPGKNLISLGGKPLIEYTISAALASAELNDVILSTDSEEIIDFASKFKVSNNGIRPAHLATDTAKTIDVVSYEIEKYEMLRGATVDALVLLQPTAPLRVAQDIDQACVLFKDKHAKSLISCYDAARFHPRIMYRREGDVLHPLLPEGNDIIRRQEFESIFVRNGAIYISDRHEIMHEKRLVNAAPVAYVMPYERSINIDELDDLLLAEHYLKTNNLKHD